jgi:seryl-tRNA synthetase
MNFYDDTLTSAERRALKKKTTDLQDEIDLVRTLIKREMSETADIEAICKAAETVAKLTKAQKSLAAKADDELKLALATALNALDEAET